MNIWYMNHYATPPDNGILGRAYYLSHYLKKFGHEVTVFCASYHHLQCDTTMHCQSEIAERFSDLDYHQIATRAYMGNGFNRLQNMRDYGKGIKKLSSGIKSGKLKRPDILVPSCAHHLAYPSAMKVAKKIGARIIYEVRDLWPLSLVEIAGLPVWHPLVVWATWIERKAYRSADAVVSLLPNAFEYMGSLGLSRDRFIYIPNGVEVSEWKKWEPLPNEKDKIFSKLKNENKLIVIYTGAHGIPNALDQILDLENINKRESRPYHFILIGEGIEKYKLMQKVKNRKINFITFWDKMPKRQVIAAIIKSDICYLGWKKLNIYKYGVSPNKLCDYLVSGKPVLYAVNAVNNPVSEVGAGISVAPYNPVELDNALNKFCKMTEKERRKMGERGRKYAIDKLDWKLLAKKYSEVCNKILPVNENKM